jgi:hypothetical protein
MRCVVQTVAMLNTSHHHRLLHGTMLCKFDPTGWLTPFSPRRGLWPLLPEVPFPDPATLKPGEYLFGVEIRCFGDGDPEWFSGWDETLTRFGGPKIGRVARLSRISESDGLIVGIDAREMWISSPLRTLASRSVDPSDWIVIEQALTARGQGGGAGVIPVEDLRQLLGLGSRSARSLWDETEAGLFDHRGQLWGTGSEMCTTAPTAPFFGFAGYRVYLSDVVVSTEMIGQAQAWLTHPREEQIWRRFETWFTSLSDEEIELRVDDAKAIGREILGVKEHPNKAGQHLSAALHVFVAQPVADREELLFAALAYALGEWTLRRLPAEQRKRELLTMARSAALLFWRIDTTREAIDSMEQAIRARRVRHPKFGIGEILGDVGSGESRKLEVRFRSGTKVLLAKFVEIL